MTSTGKREKKTKTHVLQVSLIYTQDNTVAKNKKKEANKLEKQISLLPDTSRVCFHTSLVSRVMESLLFVSLLDMLFIL